jgi:hypothetical protein
VRVELGSSFDPSEKGRAFQESFSCAVAAQFIEREMRTLESGSANKDMIIGIRRNLNPLLTDVEE